MKRSFLGSTFILPAFVKYFLLLKISYLCSSVGMIRYESLDFDENEFNTKLVETKETRLQNLVTNTSVAISPAALTKLKTTVPVTDSSPKYEYKRITSSDGKVKYVFSEVQAVVQAVIKQGDVIDKSHGVEGERVGVILDRTPLYAEAGGQQADKGQVEGEGWLLECDAVYNVGGYQLHVGTLRILSREPCLLVPGAQVSVRMDTECRLANMRNHTATHCLNSVLHHMFTATHQMGSCVTQDQLTFDFATYGQPVTKQHLSEMEDGVLRMVSSSLPVARFTVTSDQLLAMDDVTLLPGETYPCNNIHLIQIQHDEFSSKEACCGTHVMNTADIEDFCVCGVQSLGSGGKCVTAVTGRAAHEAGLAGRRALELVTALHSQIVSSPPSDTQSQEKISAQLQGTKKIILEEVMPYRDQIKCLELLEYAAKSLKDSARGLLRLSVEEEMKQVLQTVTAGDNCRFLVHCLHSTSQLDKIPLQKVTKMCPLHLPVIIFACAENLLKARCCVPQVKVSHKASAESWMAPVLEALTASGGAPRGQDPRLVYNMKPLRVSPSNKQVLIARAVNVARQTANKLFE